MRQFKLKNYEFILILFQIILLSVSHITNNFIGLFVSNIIFLFIVVIFSKENFYYYMLFFLSWSPVLKVAPNTFSFFTIANIFLTIKVLFNNREKISLKKLFLIVLLLCFSFVSKIFIGEFISLDYIVFFCNMLLFSIFCKRDNIKKINIKKLVNYLSLGIISACFASSILMKYPHMLNYIDVYTWDKMNLIRLSGFYGDANFYSAQIIAAISCNLYLMTKNNKIIYYRIFLILVLASYGCLSVSKSFLFLLLIILFIFIVKIFTKYKFKYKFQTLFILIFLLLFIFFSGFFNNIISMYSTRFQIAKESSDLTTGRTDIYSNYINYFFNHPINMIMGQGYTDLLYEDFSYKASHNSFIQSIYQFGIIGTCILLLWVKTIIEDIKLLRNRVNIYDKLILIIGFIGPWLAIDILFFDDFFYLLFLFLILYNYGGNTYDKKNF